MLKFYVSDRSKIQTALRAIKTIPIFVPTFNNPTYANNMAKQIYKHGLGEIVFLDGVSRYPEMTRFLATNNHHVVTLEENFGPRHIITNSDIYDILPDLFVLTDPDLEFSINLPNNFIEKLITISNTFSIGKLGLALSISDSEDFVNSQLFIGERYYSIQEWESQFWTKPETYDAFSGFIADIDTTFALYNKKFYKPNEFASAVRLSTYQGIDIACKHLPWYRNTQIPNDERDYYKNLREPNDFSYYGLTLSAITL